MLAAVLDQLVNAIGGGAGAYPLILIIVLGDAILPLLPGETAIITGGILASRGDLFVGFVLLAAALGAFIGDNITYWIGRTAGQAATRRMFRGEKSQRRLHWAAGQLTTRGMTIIVVARFIPGGRTATTFTAGTLHMDYRRFVIADAAGATLWSAYATALGYFGGAAFKNSLWKPLVIALATAGLLGLVVEAWRRLRENARA
jgi:membrane protein DedA with SNARE-associated domain